jgi:hypothetical protein
LRCESGVGFRIGKPKVRHGDLEKGSLFSFFCFSGPFLSSHAYTLVSGIAPIAHRTSATSLSALLPKEEMDTDQLEIFKITERWNEVRLLSKEEAAKLEPEWKEAYERYYEKYDRDMSMMEEIAAKLLSMIEPPNVKAKTKGQRRRDAWAKKQASAAARALKN